MNISFQPLFELKRSIRSPTPLKVLKDFSLLSVWSFLAVIIHQHLIFVRSGLLAELTLARGPAWMNLEHPESALTCWTVGVSQARLPSDMGYAVSKCVPLNDYFYRMCRSWWISYHDVQKSPDWYRYLTYPYCIGFQICLRIMQYAGPPGLEKVDYHSMV